MALPSESSLVGACATTLSFEWSGATRAGEGRGAAATAGESGFGVACEQPNPNKRAARVTALRFMDLLLVVHSDVRDAHRFDDWRAIESRTHADPVSKVHATLDTGEMTTKTRNRAGRHVTTCHA